MKSRIDSELAELEATLTICQLLMLFQTKRLARLPGTFEAVTTSHSLQVSPSHFLAGTNCSELDWLERAQARGLESLGLVALNRDKTRWNLTPKGERAVQLYRDQVITQLPEE